MTMTNLRKQLETEWKDYKDYIVVAVTLGELRELLNDQISEGE